MFCLNIFPNTFTFFRYFFFPCNDGIRKLRYTSDMCTCNDSWICDWKVIKHLKREIRVIDFFSSDAYPNDELPSRHIRSEFSMKAQQYPPVFGQMDTLKGHQFSLPEQESKMLSDCRKWLHWNEVRLGNLGNFFRGLIGMIMGSIPSNCGNCGNVEGLFLMYFIVGAEVRKCDLWKWEVGNKI